MLSCTYEVVAIDGDYAHLRRNDIEPEDNETKLVARALLPPEIMEGIFLKYKIFLQTIHFQSFHYTHFSVIQEDIFLIDLIFIDNTSYNRRQIILFYCKITLL